MSDKYELWLDSLVKNLMGSNGGPYLGNLGAPVTPNHNLAQCLNDYLLLKEQTEKINKRKSIINYYTQDAKIEILEKRITELEEIIKNKK